MDRHRPYRRRALRQPFPPPLHRRQPLLPHPSPPAWPTRAPIGRAPPTGYVSRRAGYPGSCRSSTGTRERRKSCSCEGPGGSGGFVNPPSRPLMGLPRTEWLHHDQTGLEALPTSRTGGPSGPVEILHPGTNAAAQGVCILASCLSLLATAHRPFPGLQRALRVATSPPEPASSPVSGICFKLNQIWAPKADSSHSQ